jgi:hypothetical protein
MSDAPNPHYRNDLWSLDDDFGLGAAGDQVARMALQVDPPFTIGVNGKWGCGKTSVMRRAFATLGGRPIQQALPFGELSKEAHGDHWARWKYDHEGRNPRLPSWPKATAEQTLGIWYSPWQHQNEANPLIPLIHEIREQFTVWLSFKEGAKQLNRQAGLAAAKLLEHLADAALSLVMERPAKLARGLTDAVRGGWKEGEDRLAALSDGQRFHLLFEDAINQLLKARTDADELGSDARLVVFVDDLDRCEGEVIVRLLEIIKLYLGTSRCVFVLGLDDGAVMAALKRHRSDSDEANREYLEKLFQATLSVPLPSARGVCDGIVRQFRLHGIPRGAAPDELQQAPIDAAHVQMAKDIERLLEPNPRKIKNFTNSLCAAWAMHDCGGWIGDDADFPAEARRFVLLHYLRHFHRPVWRLLERQPEAIDVLRAVLSGQAATEAGGDDVLETGLLKEVFTRAFSHILGSIDRENLRHGNESLDDAVRIANERRDRRRSDVNFQTLFKELYETGRTIDPRHIFLRVDIEPAGDLPDGTQPSDVDADAGAAPLAEHIDAAADPTTDPIPDQDD